jgi:1,4-dihydroxy-2-naphthoate octaprenyltransferase
MAESTVKAWLLAARPKTLWAGVVPVLMGSAMASADGLFHAPAAAAALVCSLLIQVGTNLANDFHDAKKGIDTKERIGPTRVTQTGLLEASVVKRAFILCFALAILLGAYLLFRGGWPILLIGLSSVALGWLYTAGPAPMSYTGSSDLFAFLYFGPVAVAGSYYVQALAWSEASLWAGMAAGGFSVALLTVNNFRDMVSDTRTGKRSLAVRFGAGFARAEFRFSLLLAAIVPFWLIHHYDAPQSLLAPAILVAAMLVPLWRTVALEPRADRDFGDAMNRLLALVGRLELLYGILFAAAWLLP